MNRLTAILLLALSVLTSCKKTPDYVIGESDMAELIADMEVADAVVEINRQNYSSDSLRDELRQSILKKHDVTEEEFDTSLMWYGHNLDIYRDVYENAKGILEDRQKDLIAEAKEAGEKMTMSGDSVDIWQGARIAIFDKKRIGGYAQLNFSIPADENTQQGDFFKWKFRILNMQSDGQALLGVDYVDGTSEYQIKSVRPEETLSIDLQADSLISVERVYGYFLYRMKDEDAIFADSISLYRSRLNRDRYNFHGFQRKIR